MSLHSNHVFHLVNYSPWPLTGAIGALSLVSGLTIWFHHYNNLLLLTGIIITLLTIYQWWRDISREGTFQGLHTLNVTLGLRWGIILFIVSEVFFFIRFFWAYFHRRYCPTFELGSNWPPKLLTPFDPFQIPLLNTAILLSSGITITWAHHGLIEGKFSQINQGLFFTILLGIYFSILQAYEYIEATFSISDSIYGTTFFIATGFHGLHVLIGTIFLIISLIRHINKHFSEEHHFGFEAAAWYWHFVDVVWLFLFISIYWWGGE